MQSSMQSKLISYLEYYDIVIASSIERLETLVVLVDSLQ